MMDMVINIVIYSIIILGVIQTIMSLGVLYRLLKRVD